MQQEIHILKDNREIADRLLSILEQQNRYDLFHLALTGGNTPRSIYPLFAQRIRNVLPVEMIRFYWGDERCVPPDDKESNYLMARETFFENLHVSSDQIFRIQGENEPELEKERYAGIISTQNQGRFDLVLLGLGSDGHTASIFPDQLQLFQSHDICESVTHPQSSQKRITITGKVINASRSVVFMVTGAGKANVVYEILNRTGKWKQYPASYVKPENGKLFWLIDEEAAGNL